MTEVLLFHHAAGQTPGFLAFADSLQAAGHVVHTPDVYDGRVLTDLDSGLAHAKKIGFGALHDRALAGDIDAARGLVTVTPQAELFVYHGDGHLFADSSLSSYDPDAAPCSPNG